MRHRYYFKRACHTREIRLFIREIKCGFKVRNKKVRLHTAINRVDFVSWCIKSHSPGYEIGPINRSVYKRIA